MDAELESDENFEFGEESADFDIFRTGGESLRSDLDGDNSPPDSLFRIEEVLEMVSRTALSRESLVAFLSWRRNCGDS